MNRFHLALFAAIILFSFPSNTKAQFVKKIQWDISLGFSQVGSKPVTTIDGTPEDLGSGNLGLANSSLWYNLNRKMSIGLNAGVMSNFPSYDTEPDATGGTRDVRYTGFNVGLSAKYHFFDKKRFKAFAYTTVDQYFNELRTPTYFRIYDPSNTDNYTIHYHSRKITFQNSLGASLGVGFSTFLSKGFGLTLTGGYHNNNYYKGSIVKVGVFFAFINS